MYYAALMLKAIGGAMVLVELEGDTFEEASESLEAVKKSDDHRYDIDLWILDICDLSNLARFFGEHRDEFKIELGG